LFKVAICDDELEVHNLTRSFFEKISERSSFAFDIQSFFSGEELLQHYRDHDRYSFHMLILDIEMNGISGMEAANQICALPDRDVQIIFLTSYPEYMLESFDVQTFQYLLKPVSYKLFEEKILKLYRYITSSTHRFFTIKTENEQVVLRNSDIIAIEKVKHSLTQNKLTVITAHQVYVVTGTLMEYSSKLNHPFIQIHRSVIVNLEHIRKFNFTSVTTSNQQMLPVGRSQVKKLKDAYARYMFVQVGEGG
jgi:two-component system response regulator LytT